MRYKEIKPLDITNGKGIRVTLFCTGCEHYCQDCFNSELWSFQSGVEFDGDSFTTLMDMLNNPLIDGLSLLGGEPLHKKNVSTIFEITKEVKTMYPDKDIWLWSGYTYEELEDMYDLKNILKYVDILIDGKYKRELRDMKLKYRGSKNQRVIDVQSSLLNKKVCLAGDMNE